MRKDYSTLIIYAALLVTAARYIGAFIASDVGEVTGWMSEVLTGLMALSGLGMGILDVIGTAYVFDGWKRVLPRSGDGWSSRFRVLTGFVVGLFACGVSILVPFTVARVSQSGMRETLGPVMVWMWALAVNVAPLLIIGGVTFSQAGFVHIQAATRNDAEGSVHDASMVKMNSRISVHQCKQCLESFATLPELASHTRWKHRQPQEAGQSNGKAI